MTAKNFVVGVIVAYVIRVILVRWATHKRAKSRLMKSIWEP